MTAVGCTPQVGKDSIGSIAVRLMNGTGSSHFRCGGVPDDSLRHAVAAYRRAARDTTGGASMEAPPGDGDGDVLVLIQYQCDLNTTVVNYGDGTYDVFQWIDNCQYWYRVLDGPGGSPSGPGSPLPPVPPLPPPLPPDSACVGTADARPVSNAGVDFGTAAPRFGPLGSLTVLNDLSAAEAAARSSNGPERGGYILAQNGVYALVSVPNTYAPGGALAGPSLCDYGMDGGMPSVTSPAYVVGFWHTHPAAGTDLSSSQCPGRAGAAVLGVSGPDQDVAMNSVSNTTTPGVSEYSNTNYVIQRESASGPIDFFRYGSNNGTYYAAPAVQRDAGSTTGCALH